VGGRENATLNRKLKMDGKKGVFISIYPGYQGSFGSGNSSFYSKVCKKQKINKKKLKKLFRDYGVRLREFGLRKEHEDIVPHIVIRYLIKPAIQTNNQIQRFSRGVFYHEIYQFLAPPGFFCRNI